MRGLGGAAYSPAVAQKATGFGDPKNEPSIINRELNDESIHPPHRPRLHRPSPDHRHPGTSRRPSRRRRAPYSGRHPTAGKPGLPRTTQQRCRSAFRLRPLAGHSAARWV
ncbi:hypothetical protein METHPM2_170031 [Pseudomonas sp. PM2]